MDCTWSLVGSANMDHPPSLCIASVAIISASSVSIILVMPPPPLPSYPHRCCIHHWYYTYTDISLPMTLPPPTSLMSHINIFQAVLSSPLLPSPLPLLLHCSHQLTSHTPLSLSPCHHSYIHTCSSTSLSIHITDVSIVIVPPLSPYLRHHDLCYCLHYTTTISIFPAPPLPKSSFLI